MSSGDQSTPTAKSTEYTSSTPPANGQQDPALEPQARGRATPDDQAALARATALASVSGEVPMADHRVVALLLVALGR